MGAGLIERITQCQTVTRDAFAVTNELKEIAERYREEAKRVFVQIENCSQVTAEVRQACAELKDNDRYSGNDRQDKTKKEVKFEPRSDGVVELPIAFAVGNSPPLAGRNGKQSPIRIKRRRIRTRARVAKEYMRSVSAICECYEILDLPRTSTAPIDRARLQ